MKIAGIPQRYNILSDLGSGGMGAIYKARDSTLDKIVAIKILKAQNIDQNSSSIQRFQIEAKALGKLRHNNIVSVLDFGLTVEGLPYLVMDYIDGITLKDLIASNGKLPIEHVLRIVIQLASAMTHAHQSGVIHRDLKSSNIIMLNNEEIDQLKIIDFGIAYIKDKDKVKLTHKNAIIGSPAYMSPEQIQGKDLDERSDIYSLGCIMFESITGELPFHAESAMATMSLHLSKTIPDIDDISKDFVHPSSVKQLINKILAKAPQRRHQSMAELHAELVKLQSEPIQEIKHIEKDKSISRDKPKYLHVFSSGVIVVASLTICSVFVSTNVFSNEEIKVLLDFFDSSKIVSTVDDKKLKMKTDNELINNSSVGHLLLENPAKVFENSNFFIFQDGNVSPELKKIKDSKRRIEKVNVRNCRLDLEDLRLITSLAPKKVDLGLCKDITEEGVHILAQNKKLEELDLDFNDNFTPGAFIHLKQLPKLKTLSLRNCNLKDRHLKSIGSLNRIERIIITQNPYVTQEGIRYLGQKGRNFEVWVDGCAVSKLAALELKELSETLNINIVTRPYKSVATNNLIRIEDGRQ